MNATRLFGLAALLAVGLADLTGAAAAVACPAPAWVAAPDDGQWLAVSKSASSIGVARTALTKATKAARGAFTNALAARLRTLFDAFHAEAGALVVPDFKGQLAVMKAAARAVLAREEIGVLDNWIDCQEGTVHVHYGIGHAPLAAALRESVRASAGTREWLVAATRDQALARLDKAIAAEFPTPATAPAAPAAPAAPVAEDPYARCPRPPWVGAPAEPGQYLAVGVGPAGADHGRSRERAYMNALSELARMIKVTVQTASESAGVGDADLVRDVARIATDGCLRGARALQYWTDCVSGEVYGLVALEPPMVRDALLRAVRSVAEARAKPQPKLEAAVEAAFAP